MKKIRKCICLLLVLILLAGTAAVPARTFAAGTGDGAYTYVALGDSIAAGLGTDEERKGAQDPALLLNEELFANPVKAAYPAVLGEMLGRLGSARGVKTETANLSTTGYLASDIVKTIQESGYKAELYEWFLENYIGEGTSEPLSKYHEYFEKYLKDADLVSIQLGANDILLGVVAAVLTTENPILKVARDALMEILSGKEIDAVVSSARSVLEKESGALTLENFAEAARLLSEMAANLGNLMQNAADQVKAVIETVKGVSPEADIVLLGMYNPYDTSGETDEKVRELGAALTSLLYEAADLIVEQLGGDVNIKDLIFPAGEGLAGETSQKKAKQSLSKTLRELEAIALVLRLTKDYAEYGKLLQKAVNLLQGVSDDTVEAVEFMLLGQNIKPHIQAYNDKLAAVAAETGAAYVDVFDIGSERNIDPNPSAESHEKIAETLYTVVSAKAAAKIEKIANTITINKSSASVLVGNTVQLKAAAAGTVTWKSSNTKVATVSKKGLVTAKGIGTASISARLASGAKAVCKVKVTCKYVYQCEKKGVYRYTTSTSTVKKLKNAGWTYKKVFRAPGTGTKVYWICNKTTKRYRYTTNLAYAKLMKKQGNTAGVAFYSTAKKTVPVYELTNGAKKETFFYTTSAAVRKEMKAKGWKENGVVWYAEPKSA